MAPTIETAHPTPLHNIDKLLVGSKVRVAGRLIAYSSTSSHFLLLYKTRAVLVDASLCINPFDSRWVRDELGILEVVGNVEAVDMDFDPPLIPAHIKVEVCEVSVLVRALLVVPRPDLDLDVWDSSVRVVSVP